MTSSIETLADAIAAAIRAPSWHALQTIQQFAPSYNDARAYDAAMRTIPDRWRPLAYIAVHATDFADVLHFSMAVRAMPSVLIPRRAPH